MKPNGYSGFQIALHWAIALLVLFNYIYSDGMGDALDAVLEGRTGEAPDLNPAIHVWVGVAVLALVVLRLVARLSRGAPEAGGSGALQVAASWGHRALYLLLFLVPLAGAITWFGKVETTGDIHALLANLLMIAAGGHAAMALWHQFVVRDGLLMRMFRPGAN
ncbi:MAG: cytochrome b [Paracoccus sp. (in: a-proteobacteria)]